MNRTPKLLTAAALTVAAVAATPVVPATGAESAIGRNAVGNGITYTIPVNAGSGVAGQCTIVADRWTADYGPSHVTATATSPLGIWTRIRCTVEKNGTTWIDKEAFEYGPVAVIDEGDGTLPVAGITICAEVESQFTVDARPYARNCSTF